MSARKGYFLDRDCSGHWYVVEEAHRDDWDQWCDWGSEDDERGWTEPDYAQRLDGSPSRVVFPSWQERN